MTIIKYIIKGQLASTQSTHPLSDLKIEALDFDLIFDDFVGSAISDEQGSFEIRFDSSYFKELFFDQKPDLYFKIFKDGKLIHDTKDSVLWNISEPEKEVVIEIELPDDETESKEGYELDKKHLLELGEYPNKTPNEIKQIIPELYEAIHNKAITNITSSITAHFESISDELKQIFNSINLKDIVLSSDNISDSLQDALITDNPSEYLQLEIDQKTDTLPIVTNLSEALLPDTPLQQNPVFSSTLNHASLLQLGKFAKINGSVIDEITKRGLYLNTLTGKQLNELVANKKITEKQAGEIELNAHLFQWAEGAFDLMAALKKAVKSQQGTDMASLRDAASVFKTASDIKKVLQKKNIALPDDIAMDEYADDLHRTLEARYPAEVFTAQFLGLENSITKDTLEDLRPLFSENPVLFGKGMSEIKLGKTSKKDGKKLITAFENIQNTINRFPGQRINDLLNDPKLNDAEKAAEATRRMSLVSDFYALNPEINFLALNYMPDSPELKQLNFGKMSETDKTGVMHTLMAQQRVWNLTNGNAETTQLLMAKGFYSATGIIATPRQEFIAVTGLEQVIANGILSEAQRKAVATAGRMGTLLELFDGFSATNIGHSSEATSEYLQRIPGFSEFLQSQGNCQCDHCESIISPSAYYMDLMEYIEKYITKANFTGSFADHAMKLENRRPDLWEMELTCESANDLVPYLVIINEVLENYIHGTGAEQENRLVVENNVYTILADASEIHSFNQPFNLALTRLETYLSHFSLSRNEIASIVLSGTSDRLNIIPHSTFQLSSSQALLIQENHISIVQNIYGFEVAESDQELQILLPIMGLTRNQFTDLIQTEYVKNYGEFNFQIKAKPLPGGVQTGVETIDGLDLSVQDRMHRFVRLWKKLGWTAQEIDLVLSCLVETRLRNTAIIPINDLAIFYSLQQRFNLDIEKVCTLYGAGALDNLSDNLLSFFYHRFNDSPYVRDIRTDLWDRSTNDPFIHPALMTGSASTASVDNTVSRLLAGFGITDGQLLTLIDRLSTAIALDLTDNSFELSFYNLSLLNQHAQISKLLNLEIDDLFDLITLGNISASGWLANISDVNNFLEFYDWWKKSNYSIDELSYIVTGSITRNSSNLLNLADIHDNLISTIRQQRSLFFSDNIFSLKTGVTEEQSRRIVKINTEGAYIDSTVDLSSYTPVISHSIINDTGISEDDLIAISMNWLDTQGRGETNAFLLTDMIELSGLTAEHSWQFFTDNSAIVTLVTPRMQAAAIKLYRLQSNIDLNTTTFTIPSGIADSTSLQTELRNKLTPYAAPGAATFSNTIFAEVAGLSAEDSKAIINANLTTLFLEQQDASLYSLMPGYDLYNPSLPLIISSNTPLAQDDAIAIVETFHIRPLLLTAFAEIFGIPESKVSAVISLAGIDLSSSSLGTKLVNLFLDNNNSTLLAEILSRIYRLVLLFKSPVFSHDVLQFVKAKGGVADSIFKYLDNRTSGISYWTPVISDVRLLSIYDDLIQRYSLEPLHIALSGYQTSGTFTETAKIAISDMLQMQKNGIESIIDNIPLLKDDTTTSTIENNAIESMAKLEKCVQLVNSLGISGITLSQIISNDFEEINKAADTLFAMFRVNYTEEKLWQEKIEPFENRIRELKRDALSDHILRNKSPAGIHPDHFITTSDLYHWFLIDTEMQGCAMTSRLVAGLSSLQLYVQRCLMNLEQNDNDTLHVSVESRGATQWQWRKNYRVWEANRKVFFWPENYIEPELRDNKTEQFIELESELLQKDIDLESSQNAFLKYMNAFEELANLKIAGSYHEIHEDYDVLHLFGVTSSDAPVYYYRTVENVKFSENNPSVGIVWNPWRKMNIQIPTRYVSPIVFNNKLYLFWVKITTRPESHMNEGTSQFIGYSHDRKVYFVLLNQDGTWTIPQAIKFDRSINLFEAKNNIFGSSVNHSSPEEDHTLYGFPFERVYPIITAFNILYIPKVNNILKDATLWNSGASYERLIPQGANLSSRGLVGGGINDTWGEEPRIIYKGGNLNYIDYSYPRFSYTYPKSSTILIYPPDDLLLRSTNILSNTGKISPQLVNGSLSDTIVNSTLSSNYYIYTSPTTSEYIIKRIGTSLSDNLINKINSDGLNGLLDINYQNTLIEKQPTFSFNGNSIYNDIQKVIEKGMPDFTGPMGVYFREIFFHIPFLIANHLNNIGKYAEAQRWYHFILDPTSDNMPDLTGLSGDEREQRKKDRIWQYIEFRNHKLKSLVEQLGDTQAITQYESDPFNPHAIARLRLGAYKKTIMMKYIDNLLDWGDKLFAQDTMESINEASLLYTMATDLLGKRPLELGACEQTKQRDMRYRQIIDNSRVQNCESFIESMENISNTRESSNGGTTTTPVMKSHKLKEAGYIGSQPGLSGASGDSITAGLDDTFIDRIGNPEDLYINPKIRKSFDKKYVDYFIADSVTSLQSQVCEFCIPPNKDLLTYWDRVEDRLFKIRNCMNISGIRRQLALYAPEIDPRLLVRARASGIPLTDILENLNGELPPYRFAFLIAKAKEYAGVLQGFGGALLGALEKNDAEELARLRLVQQDAILKKTTKLRDYEIDAAAASLESLNRRKLSIKNRIQYFEDLVETGLISSESNQSNLKNAAKLLELPIAYLNISSAALALPPSVLGMSFSSPTSDSGNNLIRVANFMNIIRSMSLSAAELSGTQANYERRTQGWKFSLEQAKNELNEIDKQIEAAEIRLKISEESKKLHEESVKQLEETFEFYQDKFTNLQLYTWLSTQLQRFYRQTYQNAMSLARQAERAFHFERGNDTETTLEGNYWDSSHAGLLAGERLMQDLRGIERRYMETNYRKMEIDQAFSLAQIDPNALLTLKTTGECEFSIPEFYFDIFYPGQYNRRVKSARLTVPCITGPYTNISTNLTLTGSQIRKEPDSGTDKLIEVPPTRTVSIATSTAQNDSGVFNLDFRDERYMPFEGAGAISTWRLTLPKNFKTFDYDSINDVILHISYTADFDEIYRKEVEEVNQLLETELSNGTIKLSRAFSLRQEFSQNFHRLLHNPVGTTTTIELGGQHFPLFLQGRILNISSAKMIIQFDKSAFLDSTGKLPAAVAGSLAIEASANGSGSAAIDFSSTGNSDLLMVDIDTTIFNHFNPSKERVELNFTVSDSGNFSPNNASPGDVSALDDNKIKDINLLIEYYISP